MPHIRFHECAVKNPGGTPPFIDGIKAEIVIDSKNTLNYEFPAMRKNETPHMVLDRAPHEIKNNWSDNLLKFLSGQEAVTGTRLETVSAISRAQVENLKQCGIYTVEDLAKSPGHILEHLGATGNKLQEIARNYLTESSGGDLEALQRENAEMKEQMAEMYTMLQTMKTRSEEKSSSENEHSLSPSNVPGFIGEKCVTGEDHTARASDIYDAYARWCAENGLGCENQRDFGVALSNLFEKGRNKDGNFYKGVALAQ